MYMMIDECDQGKGMGGEALSKVLDYIKTKPFGGTDRVTLTCNKENGIVMRLYTKKGFMLTGNEDEDEVELSLLLNRKK